jgi:hypothetical protein
MRSNLGTRSLGPHLAEQLEKHHLYLALSPTTGGF